jgi:GNAT superfamily N-acetyltransferase
MNIDFRRMTDHQAVEQLIASVIDLDDDGTSSNLTVKEILDQVERRLAVIVVEQDAIAVIRPEGYRSENGNAVLWLLFVRPELRGQGIGTRFVQKLRTRFEGVKPMVLVCNGPRREAFFAWCGFMFKEGLGATGIVMVSDLLHRPQQLT